MSTQVKAVKIAKKEVKEIKEVKKEKTLIRLSESEKASQKDVYVLNETTKKHVKKDSPIGERILRGETIEKISTPNEILTLVVRSLQNLAPELLSNSVIKTTLSTIKGIPRTFPSEWGGKGKKPRPADKPRGFKNAYIIFASEKRPEIVAKNPGVPNSVKKGLTTPSITSIIVERWNNLKDRSKYENEAKADSERYEREMKIWEEKNPDLARKTSKPKTPKKTTGWLVFSKEKRPEIKKANPTKNGHEIGFLISHAWKELTVEGKIPYEEKSKKANLTIMKDDKVIVIAPKEKKAKASKAKASKVEEEEIEEDDEALLVEG